MSLILPGQYVWYRIAGEDGGKGHEVTAKAVTGVYEPMPGKPVIDIDIEIRMAGKPTTLTVPADQVRRLIPPRRVA